MATPMLWTKFSRPTRYVGRYVSNETIRCALLEFASLTLYALLVSSIVVRLLVISAITFHAPALQTTYNTLLASITLTKAVLLRHLDWIICRSVGRSSVHRIDTFGDLHLRSTFVSVMYRVHASTVIAYLQSASGKLRALRLT